MKPTDLRNIAWLREIVNVSIPFLAETAWSRRYHLIHALFAEELETLNQGSLMNFPSSIYPGLKAFRGFKLSLFNEFKLTSLH